MIDPLIGARAIHIAATAFVVGMMFFTAVIARPILTRPGDKKARDYFATLTALLWIGLALALASGLAWALFLAAQIDDATLGQVLSDGTLLVLLTETRFGHVWIVRATLAVIVALTLLAADKRLAWLGLLCAGILLAALARIGHAGARADPIGWLQVSADAAHLLAAGVWLGSLPALAILLSSPVQRDALAAATRRFSAFGMIAVATLLVSGIVNTVFLTDSLWALPETTYGRLVLAKVGLFASMLALATANRWYWTPRLSTARGVSGLRRNSMVEAGLGFLVIVIVGVLGTISPPIHRHSHVGDAPPEAAFVHIHDVNGMADVTVLPGRPGPSEVWLRLMRDDFTPLAAHAVTLRLSQPGQKTVTAQAHSGVLGLWRAPDIVLPAPGVWSIVVAIETGEGGAPLILDAPIVLNPSSR